MRKALTQLNKQSDETRYTLISSVDERRFFTREAITALVEQQISIVYITSTHHHSLTHTISLVRIIDSQLDEIGRFSIGGYTSGSLKFDLNQTIDMNIRTESDDVTISGMNIARAMICWLLHKLNMNANAILYIDSDVSSGFWDKLGMLTTVQHRIDNFLSTIMHHYDENNVDELYIEIRKSIESNNSLRNNTFYPQYDFVAERLNEMHALLEDINDESFAARRIELINIATSILNELESHSSYGWEKQITVSRIKPFCTKMALSRRIRRSV